MNQTIFGFPAFSTASTIGAPSSAFIANGFSRAIILPAWTVLDHVGAVAVSIFIFQAALKIAWPGLREMMETGASKETLDRIKVIVCQNEAVVQVHGLRTRYVGNNLQVDMHVVVDGSITVAKGHDIAEDVKAEILEENMDVLDVVVHIEPRESEMD